MLYKIEEGVEEKDRYGIALARVMPFPESLLSRAAVVSEALRKQSERGEAERGLSSTVLLERRRKLILNLKEQLLQLRAATAAASSSRHSTNNSKNGATAIFAPAPTATDPTAGSGIVDTEMSSDANDDTNRVNNSDDDDYNDGTSNNGITDTMLTTRLKELRKAFVLDMTALMDAADGRR